MINLAKPDIREADIARAVAVLKSGMLVQGQNVKSFEQKLAGFADLPHAVAVSSGTAALHLSLKALGIGHGDTVLVPAFTFPATANAVEAVGATTALCDVERGSYVVTPEAIERRIGELRDQHIEAVMVVHEFGYPARIAEIAEICHRNSLVLIEDAACALGTVADGKHPGYHSDAACFSFHPRKAITTGEGGAVITRRADIADKVAALRNHGMVYCPDGIDFQEAGLNYRLTDFQAALALGQLDRFGDELAKRRQLAKGYLKELDGTDGLTLPVIPEGHSLQSFMVVCDGTINRKNVIDAMLADGVQTNLGAQALNCMSYYQRRYGWKDASCPVALRLYRSGLVLPLYGALTADGVEGICATLRAHLTPLQPTEGGRQ